MTMIISFLLQLTKRGAAKPSKIIDENAITLHIDVPSTLTYAALVQTASYVNLQQCRYLGDGVVKLQTNNIISIAYKTTQSNKNSHYFPSMDNMERKGNV